MGQHLYLIPLLLLAAEVTERVDDDAEDDVQQNNDQQQKKQQFEGRALQLGFQGKASSVQQRNSCGR